jgi:hypothetical protein
MSLYEIRTERALQSAQAEIKEMLVLAKRAQKALDKIWPNIDEDEKHYPDFMEVYELIDEILIQPGAGGQNGNH